MQNECEIVSKWKQASQALLMAWNSVSQREARQSAKDSLCATLERVKLRLHDTTETILQESVQQLQQPLVPQQWENSDIDTGFSAAEQVLAKPYILSVTSLSGALSAIVDEERLSLHSVLLSRRGVTDEDIQAVLADYTVTVEDLISTTRHHVQSVGLHASARRLAESCKACDTFCTVFVVVSVFRFAAWCAHLLSVFCV